MFVFFACYSRFLSFLTEFPLYKRVTPYQYTIFSHWKRYTIVTHVFMCKFALDKFTLYVNNKRKIKRISPKCVLFHILFGKFVKLTTLVFACDYVVRETAIFLHFMDFVWCTMTHTSDKKEKNEKWQGSNSHKQPQHFVLIIWKMTMDVL